jgi:chaperonin GroES
MKIKPLGDRVLIKPSEAETKTSGGIYLPDSATDEIYVKGEVVEVSDMEKCPVKPGDKVLFEPATAQEIKMDEETMKLVNVRNLIAKLR